MEAVRRPITKHLAGCLLMLRIVDGIPLIGKPSVDRWEVTRRTLSGGHVELSARRAIDWREAEWCPEKARRDLIDKYGLAEVERREAEALADRQAANIERAARRAKTRVRHLCKVQGLDTLLTLTYRENMQDQARAWADLKEFVRRMRRALGSFAYVAVAERQARGAIHWHLAVHRLPMVMGASNGVKVKAFNVIRAIWRAVAGDGNIDVSRRRRASRKSPARIASYISKYVAKAFADTAKGVNRYSSSTGVELPRPDRFEVRAADLAELLGQVYADAWGGSLVMVSAWLCPYGDACYFAAESPGET